jgi:hypothetical protein
MAHGTPDWGFGLLQTVHSLSDDLAELAARLGSIHAFDRRGYSIWFDDFRRGIDTWRQETGGTGASVELDTNYPHWPPYAVKMVGGSDGTRQAAIYQYLAAVPAGNLGLEVSIAFPTAFDYFVAHLTLVENDTWHHARVKLDYANSKIYYRDGDGTWVELDDLPTLVSDYGLFHALKLAANFEDNEYIRLILNENSYDLSSLTLQELEEAYVSHLLIILQFFSRSGQNDYCYVDGVIVTQNE